MKNGAAKAATVSLQARESGLGVDEDVTAHAGPGEMARQLRSAVEERDRRGAKDNQHVGVAKSARKQFDKLPARDFARIDAAIESMCVDPFQGNVVHLTNAEAACRRRVGDYRILIDVVRENRHVDVVAILRRTTTTYRKRRR